MSNIITKHPIIPILIIALLLSYITPINYIILLLIIGLIIGYISDSIFKSIITGTLYVILSFISSYPGALSLAQYMPNIDIPVNSTFYSVATNLSILIIIPVLIAIILTTIGAIFGKQLKKITRKNNPKKDNKIKKKEYITQKHNYKKKPTTRIDKKKKNRKNQGDE
ncbi:MAG: hypothetical protein Q4Q23_01825 [Methanobacteriaceae archaeon]|nr:hypothetical protein [Methanobacteriaceae archaeon]